MLIGSTPRKDVFAVVICDPKGPRAVDVEAHERLIDEFVTEISELESLLRKYRSTDRQGSGSG
jgi:hypothetical protein